MKLNIRSVVVAVSLGLSIIALDATVDDARKLMDAGKYSDAISLLEPLSKKSPKDLNVKLALGEAYLLDGEIAKGESVLKDAVKKGSMNASKILAEHYLESYMPDEADQYLDSWREKLVKTKNPDMSQYDKMAAHSIMLKNMLDHVEKIVIIDSLQVDKDMFFKHYRLSKEAGKLLSGSDLQMNSVNMVYVPENRREMFWSVPDSTGKIKLLNATILDDGSVDTTRPVDIKDTYKNADYPFLMPDGMTFYFASEGDESLGGYDIFMTRRDGDNWLEPVNVGMPYNSPANDYMMALDEATGLGWWATDRNAPDGKVTVYTFIISNMRVNYPVEIDNIGQFAKVSSIASTWQNTDIETWKQKLAALDSGVDNAEFDNAIESLTLSLGNGEVIYSLDEIVDSNAYATAKELIAARKQLESLRRQLSAMRKSYNPNDTGAKAKILSLEKEETNLLVRIKKLRNTVVRQEVGNK